MKQKSTTTADEARFEERRKYFLDQFFQDESALENAINAELWDECAVDFIRNRMMSFVRKFYPLEDAVGDEHHTMTDMMRREGGVILDYLYRAVRSKAGRNACKLAEKEFPGIKEKRQRFNDIEKRANALFDEYIDHPGCYAKEVNRIVNSKASSDLIESRFYCILAKRHSFNEKDLLAQEGEVVFSILYNNILDAVRLTARKRAEKEFEERMIDETP